MVAHIFNPSTWKAETEAEADLSVFQGQRDLQSKFQSSKGYTEKLKKKKKEKEEEKEEEGEGEEKRGGGGGGKRKEGGRKRRQEEEDQKLLHWISHLSLAG